jgi:hypothetical protein
MGNENVAAGVFFYCCSKLKGTGKEYGKRRDEDKRL